MKRTVKIIAFLLTVMIYIGCKKMEMDVDSYSAIPILPTPAYDYGVGLDNNKAALGRVLFYDTKMSLNNSIACASCHQQSKAFCDNKQFTPGLQDVLTRRNTPTILVHDNKLFWDGRASSFHELAVMPLKNHVEMKNYDISQLESKIANIQYYPPLFNSAFGTDEITIDKIQQALGAFMSAFVFFNNKRENMHHGLASFTAEENLGEELFFGKAKCGHCHSAAPPSGGWGGGSLTGAQECIGLDESYEDNGVGEFSLVESDNAKFRVPTLLNVEFTSPYMHDGRFKTLEEVVEHYNSGVKAHPNLSWALTNFPQFEGMTNLEITILLDTNMDGQINEDEIPPGTPVRLNLTEIEKKALVAFLKTLSDYNVFTDIRYSDPFKIK